MTHGGRIEGDGHTANSSPGAGELAEGQPLARSQTPSRMERMMAELCRRCPDIELPTPEDPLPESLLAALRKYPVTLIYRENWEPRTSPPFWMLEDIREQPELCRRVLKEQSAALSRLAAEIATRGTEAVISTGCGTAFYSAMMGNDACAALTDLPVRAVEALELARYTRLRRPRETVVIAHSATGSSFETVEAVRRAKELGAYTVALVNTHESPLNALCDATVICSSGQRSAPCVSVVSTRVIAHCLLAVHAARHAPGASADRVETAFSQLVRLPDLMERCLAEQDASIAALAARYRHLGIFQVVGAGPACGLALEAALKLAEASAGTIFAKAFETAEWLHNATLQTTADMVTVVLAPPGPGYSRTVDVVRTANAVGSPTVALVAEGDLEIAKQATDSIRLAPEIIEEFAPLYYLIPLQLLTYYSGIERGVNTDTIRAEDPKYLGAMFTGFPLDYH